MIHVCTEFDLSPLNDYKSINEWSGACIGFLTFWHQTMCRSLWRAVANSSKKWKLDIFNLLIWGHSRIIIHTKFGTRHQKDIANHNLLSKICVISRKCMTSNFHLIFPFWPLSVFIESWRIKFLSEWSWLKLSRMFVYRNLY